jgi:hypothetical protein
MDYYFNEKDSTHWRRKLAMQQENNIYDEVTVKAAQEEARYFNLKKTGSVKPLSNTVAMVTDIGEIILESVE